MYSDGKGWQEWMLTFKFGAFSFLPEGDLKAVAAQLRALHDPVSARTCAPHVTITQPFVTAPDARQLDVIKEVLRSISRFGARIGPAVASPNMRLLWLDVEPKKPVLNLRDRLHETGLFNTALPLTKGFLPHLTISEASREPEEINEILVGLNRRYRPWHVEFDRVSWMVPDASFVFREYQVFRLG